MLPRPLRLLVVSLTVLACWVPGAHAAATLFTGQTLASGQSLTSPDGHYALTMQTDGNLVLTLTNPYGAPRTLWSTGTGAFPGATATLQSSGDLVVTDAAGATVWSANAVGSGCENLDVQTDGNLVLYDSAGAYWATGSELHGMEPGDELLPGEVIYGGGGHSYLEMSNGYLETVTSDGVGFTSTPTGPTGSYAEMSADGELEVVNPEGGVVWENGTSDAGSYATVGVTGYLYVNESDGTLVWDEKHGPDSTTGLAEYNGARPLQACPAPAAPPAPVTTPTTPVVSPSPSRHHSRLPGIRVSIEVQWKYQGRQTWPRRIVVRRFPARAQLTVTCLGRGCPTRHVRIGHRRVLRRRSFHARDRRALPTMIRSLLGVRFRAGDRIVFAVTERRHSAARSEVLIRDNRSPTSRHLRR